MGGNEEQENLKTEESVLSNFYNLSDLSLDRHTDLEKLLREASYSGERIVVSGKDGAVAALVPLEDLLELSSIDNERVLFYSIK